MKKILLASTVLVSVAGYAAADVAVSGNARMGVVSTDSATTFSSRVRMSFSGTGTTDGGLAFGGKFDAQDTDSANAGTAGSVFISGAFGKISFGGVDSGDAAAVGQLASVGYTGLGSTNSINYAADGFDLSGMPAKVSSSYDDYWNDSDEAGSYTTTVSTEVNGGAGAKVLYTYSAGGLTVDASTSQISNAGSHSSYGIGVAYTTGGLTLAGGYGSNEFDITTTEASAGLYVDVSSDPEIDQWTNTHWTYAGEGSVTDATASATYVMGDTTIKAIYQDKQADISMYDDDLEVTNDLSASAVSYGMSVKHSIDALTLTAFAVTTELKDGITADLGDYTWDAETISLNRYGIGASYDLGGGATLAAGAVRVETPDVTTEVDFDGYDSVATGMHKDAYTAFDIGVNFSF